MRALGLLLAIALLVAGACGGEQGTEATAPAPPTETAPRAKTSDRAPAPPVAGTTLDGEELALADFRGTPVLVNVWSSW